MSTGESKNVHASPNSALSRSFHCPQKADFTKIANFSTFCIYKHALYIVYYDKRPGARRTGIFHL